MEGGGGNPRLPKLSHLDGENFDDEEGGLTTRSGHFHEPGAAQTGRNGNGPGFVKLNNIFSSIRARFVPFE